MDEGSQLVFTAGFYLQLARLYRDGLADSAGRLGAGGSSRAARELEEERARIYSEMARTCLEISRDAEKKIWEDLPDHRWAVRRPPSR